MWIQGIEVQQILQVLYYPFIPFRHITSPTGLARKSKDRLGQHQGLYHVFGSIFTRNASTFSYLLRIVHTQNKCTLSTRFIQQSTLMNYGVRKFTFEKGIVDFTLDDI